MNVLGNISSFTSLIATRNSSNKANHISHLHQRIQRNWSKIDIRESRPKTLKAQSHVHLHLEVLGVNAPLG